MATTSPTRHAASEVRSAEISQQHDAETGAIAWLSSLVASAVLVVTGIGLLWRGPTEANSFTSIRGERVELFGHGLYRHDTLFVGAGFRGTDVVTACIGVPLLVAAIVWFLRGSLRGRLLLSGILSYMLYVYGSMSLGAAFNGLFLAYIAITSASVFALGLTLRSIDMAQLKAHFSDRTPHQAAAIFLLVAGLVTSVVWLLPLITNMLAGDPPKLLDSYTTVVTDVLDLGLVAPLLFLSGILILRGATFGYLIAFPLFGIIVVLAPAIVAATISQISAGVEFSPGEVIGPIAGFTILGAFAIWLLVTLLNNVNDSRYM